MMVVSSPPRLCLAALGMCLISLVCRYGWKIEPGSGGNREPTEGSSSAPEGVWAGPVSGTADWVGPPMGGL